MRFIYDLDHTVINSTHRQSTLADGSLDLAHWIENNTPEKIWRDSLLPLAHQWRTQYARGAEIVVCTARVMQDADYAFLNHHGLIAQEVEALIEETGVDFGGFQDHSRSGGQDVKSIGYSELIAPMIKAIQEQQGLLEAQRAEIETLKARLNMGGL